MKIWITPAAASAPNSALSGPRTTSTRSTPSEVKCSRCISPPGSFKRHAIQQDQRASAIGAARKDVRQRAGRSIGGNLKAGNLAQDVEQHRVIQRAASCCPVMTVGGDGGLLGVVSVRVAETTTFLDRAGDRERDLVVGCRR